MMRRFDYLRRYMKYSPDDGGAGGGSGAVAPSDSGSGSAPSTGGDSGGGASPSPAASPDGGGSVSPPAPPSTPSAQPTPDVDPWANLGSVDDLDALEIAAQNAAPPAQPQTPQQPQSPQQPIPPVTPQQPAPTQPQQPSQPQPQQPAVADLSPDDPAGIASALEARRSDVIAHLATTKFALTPEEVQEIETDAVAAIPKLLSRAFVEAQIASQKFLAQAVPGMIAKQQRVSTENTKAQSKFFELNKHLGLDPNNEQHAAAALRMARVYKQANPQMPFDQLARDVGMMVAQSLQIRASAPPVAPTMPSMPRGGHGFIPAVNGGGGSNPNPVDENPWAGIGATFDE